MTERFSERFGYQPPAAEISVREDAPVALRQAIPLIAVSAGLLRVDVHQVICEVLLEQPIPRDIDAMNPEKEINDILMKVDWYRIYDIVEALYATVVSKFFPLNKVRANKFERLLNRFFVENGIGWELRDGRIIYRGSEAFEKSTHEVPDHLDALGFPSSAEQMREALRDISRRPDPDITGAIHHAMAALEATAREVTGQPKPTLGKLVPALGLPTPLDQAVSKLWGYASEHGRHIREQQQTPSPAEAELIVSVAGALCAFIAQSRI